MPKNISSLHLDILDSERQNLLQELLPLAKGFVLGGGTALALHLAHRKSFDFDFFSRTPISKNFLEKISRTIPIANIAIDTPDELTFFTKNNVKVTFLYYPFSDLYPIEEYDNGLKMFTVEDIAIKKAYTIGRRGEYRDYFDLYCILHNKYMTLERLIADAKKVYVSIFEEKIFLQQLVYFDDLLNFEIIPVDTNPVATQEEIKNFFEKQVSNYL